MSRILEPSPQGLISRGEIKQSKNYFSETFTYFIERQIDLFVHEISQFGEINFRQPNNHGDLNKRLHNYNHLHIYLFINQEKWVLMIWFKTCSYKIYERINECYSICVILYLAVFAIFGFLCVSDDLVLSRCSWIFFWHNLIFFFRLKVICFIIYMLIGSVVFEMIGLLYFMTLIRILSDYLFPFLSDLFKFLNIFQWW